MPSSIPRIYAVIGLALMPVYMLLSAEHAELIYQLVLLAAVFAIGDRARREVGPRRTTWALFGIGLLCWFVGEVIGNTGIWNTSGGAASLVDVFFLAGYPFLAASIMRATRLRSPRRDSLSTIDGLLVAVAVSVPLYVLWVAPTIGDASLDSVATAVALAYPVMDLVLVAAAARFVLSNGAWPHSTIAFMSGVGLTIVSDAVFNLQSVSGTYEQPGLVDLGWIAAYSLWGSCAVRPAGTAELAPGRRPNGVRLHKRTWILALIVVLPLGVVANAYIRGTDLDATQIFVPLAAITGLTLVRLRLLARRSSTAWQGVAILSATAIITVAVAYSITNSNAGGRDQEAAAARLEHLAVEIQKSDGILAWTLTVGRDEQAPLMPRVAAARDDVQRAARAIDIPAEARITALVDAYGAIADDAFTRMQRSTSDSRGLRDALLSTMPARTELTTVVQDTAARYRDAATASARRGRLISVIVLGLALSALWLLMVRFGAVSRRAESAEERSRAMRESEDRTRALLAASTDLLTVVDPQTRVLAHADQVARVFELGGVDGPLRLDAFLDELQAAETHAALASIAGRAGATTHLEWTVHHPGGGLRFAEVSAVDHTGDPRIGGIVLSVRDVTDRRRLEAELEHQALHDPLTGLANRALLTDRLTQLVARAGARNEQHALVILDLDDFRAVNDAFGHGQGDQLLAEVATRLADQAGALDTLARVGGDSFAVLVESVSSEADALARAEALLDALQAPISVAGGEHLLRASIGVSVSDGGGSPDHAAETASVMFRDAELAMYEAKRQEGNSAELFADHMHEAVTQRIALRAEMVLGLERDEFYLQYQPIVELDNRRIVGYEALVRWNHPERGFVSPADFIPVAEQSGLIVELGDWVLREATRQLVEWQAGWGEERYISVNVAGQQLERPEHLGQVRAALAASGLEPHQLLLEVTESSLIGDTDASIARLEALRQLGVRLAIDDFGTGYSSLNYLHRFAVDVLKIDKSFIDDIEDEGRGRALIDAIVSMARRLGLTVVAEGIEERGQLSVLATMDCSLGQGFHFSRPLPAIDVPDFEVPGSIRRVA